MISTRRTLVTAAVAVTTACALLSACAGNELHNDMAEAATTSTTTTSTAPGVTTTTMPGPTSTLPTPQPPGPETGFPADWRPSELDWQPCSGDAEAQCAFLEVPLDWSQPRGQQISLAVARYAASGERTGALFANPGGPGASGIKFLLSGVLDREALAAFDLVSWDPRGVGLSTSLTCATGLPGYLTLDPDPDTPDEQAALQNAAGSAFDECTADPEDARLLPFLGTDDNARDLEALRMALKDERLNYIGFSYGTYLGERYLDFFPTRARAVVLDGVIDPSLSLTKVLEGQTVATDAALQRLLAACDDNASCVLSDPDRTYALVRAQIETAPIPGDDPQQALTPAVFDAAAVFATYDPMSWNEFVDGLAEAADGDGARLVSMARRFRDSLGFATYAAVTCLDSVRPAGQDAWRLFVDGLRLRSAKIGASIGNEMLPCATWPVAPKDSTGPVTADGSAAILVVGNTGDNATPYTWAEAVAETLSNGHLLTYEGEGHTSYGRDECVDAIIHRYLVSLEVPPEGATCAGGGGGQAAP